MGKHKYLLIFLYVIFYTALQGCALGPAVYIQCFSFDAFRDSPEIEVLDYRYGDCRQFGTCEDEYRVARGEIAGGWRTCGYYPRSKSLYVKWRVKATGKIYEDNVDLDSRMPRNITDYRIHFVVRREQLYVYLLPPPYSTWPASLSRPVSKEISQYLRKHLIYPDNPKEYPDRIMN